MSDDLNNQNPWARERANSEAGTSSAAHESPALAPPWDAPRPNFSHPSYGAPSGIWPYKSTTADLLYYIARYDPPHERKKFIPYTYHDDGRGGGWKRTAWPTPRPPFGLDKLAARPEAQVLIVEGEKAAVGLDGHGGAAALLTSHVCITSSGGAHAAESTDWSALAGRDVVIWPDADDPGADYARDVAQLVLQAGGRCVRVVDVSGFPEGFDLGDELPPGLDVEDRVRSARECGRYVSYSRFTMDPDQGLSVEIEKNGEFETHFISNPFEVLGRVRTNDGQQWAKRLRWRDEDGRTHDASIPDAELHGEPKALAAKLAAQGLKVSTAKGRPHLAHYLNGVPCDRRLTLIERTGWHEIDGQPVFVLPERTIGTASVALVLNSSGASPYQAHGSLAEWQRGIGSLVSGHTRPMFAVSTAFAGTLLRIMDQEGGGFHLFGGSSIGKTAAAAAAASVFGRGSSPGFIRPWRATANAIEAAAALHSDSILALDEIGLVDAREAAQVVYQLAGGVGKGRMAKDLAMRPSLTWGTIVLSTGEIPLADKLRENGQRPMAGQAVRLNDIPADVGKGFGSFDHPGETGSSKELADAIKLAARTHYGTAGPAFIDRLLRSGLPEVQEAIRAVIGKFRADNVPEGSDGQVQRAADRFGLVAAAGELACEYGIVPWPEGSAYNAASECFRAWLDQRGGIEPAEVPQAIARVRRFIETHGESRFVEINTDLSNSRPVMSRAGYRRGSGEAEQWLVLPETWKEEVCVGLDPTQTARILAKRGMLIRGRDGFTKVERIQGRPTRVYVLTARILAGEADE